MENILQDSAEEIVNKINLDFSDIGELHLVGNVALGTTVKPDIDFQLYTDHDFKSSADKVSHYLESTGVTNVATRTLKLSHNKTLVTGVYPYKGADWTIDISITTPIDDYILDGYRFLTEYKPLINDKNISTITELKNHFLKKNMLWNGMSYYVYRAVIDENVSSVKEMFDYLERNKINIKRFKRRGLND